MTIEWNTFVKGVTTVVSSVTSYMQADNKEEEDKEIVKVEKVDMDKLVESVSGAVCIALLPMMDPDTKIQVVKNMIQFDAPWLFQWWSRQGVASRKDFKKYKIFHRCVVMPQTWHETGSDAAKAIARIQKIMIDGMEIIKKLYADDYVPDHVDGYVDLSNKFIRANLPDAEAIRESAEKKLLSSPIHTDDENDDILSEISDDDVKAVKVATDKDISNVMKSLWPTKELETIANTLETIREHFESEDKLVRAGVKGEIQALISQMKTKVSVYRAKVNEDMANRY